MGKGSDPRPMSITQDEYYNKYDRIFGKKDKIPKHTKEFEIARDVTGADGKMNISDEEAKRLMNELINDPNKAKISAEDYQEKLREDNRDK